MKTRKEVITPFLDENGHHACINTREFGPGEDPEKWLILTWLEVIPNDSPEGVFADISIPLSLRSMHILRNAIDEHITLREARGLEE